MSVRSELKAELPSRPRLVLRVAFAGSQKIAGEAEARLASMLVEVFEAMGHQLAAIAPGVPVLAWQEPKVAAFYEPSCPLLRVVTGLCEGADAIAAQALEKVAIVPDGESVASPGDVSLSASSCLETELAAVLPFDFLSYRASRTPEFRAEFDRQAERCGYILTLDGLYAKPDPDEELAHKRRARGYRSQSAVLLRHGDLLVAAANPDDPAKAGGTLETVDRALDFGLPVVFVHTGTGAVRLIDPGDDLHTALAAPAAADWPAGLQHLVLRIVANPDVGLDMAGHDDASEQHSGDSDHLRVLSEYFDHAQMPPRAPTIVGNPPRKKSVREKVWNWFVERLKRGYEPNVESSGKSADSKPLTPQPFKAYRARATDLNYHYSGLYRGAFLFNYVLAVVAVFLAALSLVLLGTGQSDASVDSSTVAGWLFPVLLGLGVLKLGVVSFIYKNTHRANHEKWNDHAVDYRYLAERLRALFYLPAVGSFHPPAPDSAQYASRVVRQSAVDWLFSAITRAVSPAEFAQRETFAIEGGESYSVNVLSLDRERLRQAVGNVREGWIVAQAGYHDGNAHTMGRLSSLTERFGSGFGLAVILFVIADVIIVAADLLHWLPHDLAHALHAWTPWLVFLAAVLPAAVAALNGIGFQSECRRLADRSALMRVLLVGRDPKHPTGRWQHADHLLTSMDHVDPAEDPAAWSLDALRLTESTAKLFVQEAAEWSVLYAKELPEPG